jgi:uncharacterized LabA/DUF88 family protein
MTKARKVMLLIDADNVSVDVIAKAIEHLRNSPYGAPQVRRAHCTPESAVRHQKLFKELSIRPVVNLAAGKNSTDIALAVDAIDLAHTERPDVVVIASSDSDFAPLVARLREKGCFVVGIGQQGKTADETKKVYDDFEDIAHGKGRASGRASRAADRPAEARAERAEERAEAAAEKRAGKPAEKRADRAPAEESDPPPAAKKTRARRKAAAAAPAAAPAPPPLPEKVQQIIDALPALARGETLELKVAAQRLKEAGLLAKSGASTKLFGRFPELFELLPAKQPNAVRRRAGS